jgi:small-conductance mechanosensitive channel
MRGAESKTAISARAHFLYARHGRLGLMWSDLLELWRSQGWMRLGVNAVLAWLIGILLCRLGRVILLRLTRDRPVATDIVQRAGAPMQWLLPLLLLSAAVHTTLQRQSGAPVPLEQLQHLLQIALITAFTWLVLRCLGGLEALAAGQYRIDVADNLKARRVLTQVRVLGRTARGIVVVLGLAAILLTIPDVRQIGTSLLASAGLAGLALGLAAKPVLSNLIAGLQIAMTQPIRLDDVVIIEGEWGRIEEITGTYVVVRIWDERRLVVPLNWFIENPFQNWTRTNAKLLGTVFLWLDYGVPLQPLRDELARLCQAAPEWDRWVCLLQVTDTSEHAMQLRCLVSSADSALNFDLRCRVREGLIDFVQRTYPDSLPRLRASVSTAPADAEPMPKPPV